MEKQIIIHLMNASARAHDLYEKSYGFFGGEIKELDRIRDYLADSLFGLFGFDQHEDIKLVTEVYDMLFSLSQTDDMEAEYKIIVSLLKKQKP